MEQNNTNSHAKRRRYSDEDRATALAALAANGGNVNQTARELGIPETTIRQWVNGGRHPATTQLSEQKKIPLSDQLENIADLLLGQVIKNIDKLSPKDAMVSVGIAIDKMRLLRGQPTNISGKEIKRDLTQLTDDELRHYEQLTRKSIVATETTGGGGNQPGVVPEVPGVLHP